MSEGTKYEYQFTIEETDVQRGETSHTKLLQMVSPESTVLECGPGGGVMTRYLKESLRCTVYILEMDPDCYTKASCYADGGVCADLEQDDWMTELEDSYFDYILYADVLEHLRDPQAVLTKMKRFLKPEGCVLLSVPNVANGDIIANLLCDQFTYTPLGLLDNTHIHLFARQNLWEMIRASGYYLAREACTKVPLFASEQGKFIPEERRSALRQALISHPTYHIYQYICCLTQQETEIISEVNNMRIYSTVGSRFYFDFGEGLSEKNRINVYPEVRGNDRLRYTVKLPKGCTAVRYDPIEMCRCILREITVEIDGMPVSAQPLNGLTVGSSVFFPTEDPQVSIIPPTGGQLLILETELIQQDWDEVVRVMAELKSVLTQEMENFESERIAHTRTAQKFSESLLECNALREELSASLLESNTLRGELSASLLENNALREELSATAAELEAIKNSRSWRITKPLRVLKQALLPKGR